VRLKGLGNTSLAQADFSDEKTMIFVIAAIFIGLK
jgi:hypothetical protein